MCAQSREPIAFGRPGGESCSPSGRKPIDLLHLGRQTLGDRALEQEVLGMFVQQLNTLDDKLAKVSIPDRLALLHTVKGTAASVGAFAIAECAAKMEDAPSSEELIVSLSALICEACDFIATINR
jgi:HPt (histidine-containing phosphotransfer) domain-containing protein